MSSSPSICRDLSQRRGRFTHAILLAIAGLLACVPATSVAAGEDYVAMGDSYSSGTGTRDYYEGCERSHSAYGWLIEPQIPGSFKLIACGGAKTTAIDSAGDEQAATATSATDYISVSIGGNDAGFTDVLIECGQPSWSSDCDGMIDTAQAYIQNTLPGRLDAVYGTLRSRSPGAVIGVVGYPRIFNGEDCNAATFFSEGEMNRLNQTADLLAEVTRDRAQAHRLSFVDARAAYLGHAVCDSAEWINGLSNPVGESFHPNASGHVGYAGIVRAALLAARPDSRAAGPNGRIAFASARGGDLEIFTVNSNGTFPVQITNNSVEDVDPAWSPDGTRLAFASGTPSSHDIWVLEANGSLTRLTSNSTDDRDPSWSPNGAYIAFRSDRTGNNEIFRMTAFGASATNLTNNSASDFAPDWSPDGSEIAFQRFSSNNEVMRMNADGQGQTNLSNNSANDGAPAWSPDGDTIAFHSNRGGTGDFEIYTMSRAGASVTQRTSNADDDEGPSYSPDGASIAFTRNVLGDREIHTMTSAGGSQTRRTSSAGTDTDASWQADSVAPQTTITGNPPSVSSQGAVTFTFDSTEPGSSFQCRVDAAAFAPCTSPHTTGDLSEGDHTFFVRATDPSGNPDATPAEHAFTVDRPNGTRITSGPAGPTNDPSPTFAFEMPGEPGATFECRIDQEAFAPCSDPGVHTTPPLEDGEYTFSVIGTDGGGNEDAEPVTREFTVDTVAPPVQIDFAPDAVGNDSQPEFEFSSADESAEFECRLGTDPWAPCTSPHSPSSALADGEHTFSVRAVDPAGNRGTEEPWTFVVDTAPPGTSIDEAPAARSTDPTPEMEFSSNEQGSTFECRIDSSSEEDWVGCESPYTTPELQDGQHTFEVRATDPAGNVDADAAPVSFGVDATAPETTITGQPDGPTNSPVFTFESDDPDPTFECRIDAGDWLKCDQRFPGGPNGPERQQQEQAIDAAGQGEHVFEVRSIDAFGNPDPSPGTASYVLDRDPPNTFISDVPARTNDSTPAFEMTSTGPEDAFECRAYRQNVPPGPWGACSSPYEADLPDGHWTFASRAIDAAGNADLTPATKSFEIDATPPQTAISSGPPAVANDSTPTFYFTKSEMDGYFECSLDGGEFSECSSPITTAPLPDGAHTFAVRATDDLANTDPTPAARDFRVDTADPDTAIVAGPPARSPDRTPTFQFASSEEQSTFRCRIDSGSWALCTSPYTSSELSFGRHLFEVRATDRFGQVDPNPARASFEVVDRPPATKACPVVRRGTAGPDVLDGTTAGDRLLGRAGNDRLRGFAGRDCLLGGGGADTLLGGGGSDVLEGGAGSDLLKTRDGRRDTLFCGPGRDVAVIDRRDAVRGCETVHRPARPVTRF